jgi:hypothetical protein
METAAKLFVFEERASDAPVVEKIWRTRSEPVESFVSVAATRSVMVVTRQNGKTYVTMRGPETKATASPIPEDAEFVGVEFGLGPELPPRHRPAAGCCRFPSKTASLYRVSVDAHHVSA